MSLLWPVAGPAQTGERPGPTRIPRTPPAWPQPRGIDEREILGEDVARCISAEREGQRRVRTLIQTQTQLEREFEELERRGDEQRQRRLTLDTEQQAVTAMLGDLKRHDRALDAARSEIEKSRLRPLRSDKEVKRVNASITDFNARVARRNELALTLRTREEALADRVTAHNASVDELMRLSAQFAERVTTYEAASSALTDDLRKFDETCVGIRRIKQ